MTAIYSGIRDLFHLCVSKGTGATLCLDIVIAVSDGGFPVSGATMAHIRATESGRAIVRKGYRKIVFPIVPIIKFLLGCSGVDKPGPTCSSVQTPSLSCNECKFG